MMKSQMHLLIIDPQNDFCDLPQAYWPAASSSGAAAQVQPSLPVPGAHQDMLRLADLIRQGADGISQISITLDSHQRIDIAHSPFWQQADGSSVSPFTQISSSDVRAGKYLPRSAQALPRVLAYLDALESTGRYQHMVWPVHCEIGSWGHNVHADVRAAYNAWEEQHLAVVNKVCKGQNPWTEHYSALQAEVPDSTDPDSSLNHALLDSLAQAETILIAGEAGSHCVKASTEHLLQFLPAGMAQKMILLTDCISPVTGFADQYQAFLQASQAQGVRLASCSEVLPKLLANAS